MRRQQTLARSVATAGVGLHSGSAVRLVVRPAPVDTGIRFVRRGGSPVAARADQAWELGWATRLGRGPHQVATVEHLLAALHGLEVDNAVVEVDGPEVPILDGSSLPFVRLLERAGLRPQARSLSTLRVTRTLEVRAGDRWIRVEPARSLAVDYAIAFPYPAIGVQRWSGMITPAIFRTALAPARTFGFLDQVAAMRRRGLARGGSLRNCVVVDGDRVLSGALRFSDEFVRHKVLDLVGDLALLDYPLAGIVTAHRAGHALHVALVRAILAAPEHWELVGDGAVAGPAPSPLASEQLVAMAG